jgi:hypothetical protein
MVIESYLLTFASAAQQFPTPATLGPAGLVRRVYVEALRSNSHVSFLGTSAVTNDGSGTGVIKEIAAPGATTAMDYYVDDDHQGLNRIDPTKYWGHGTTGEKMKVSYFIG